MSNRVSYKKGVSIAHTVLGFVFLVGFLSCDKSKKHAEGEELAKVHCASCHKFPEPLTLPRRIWGEKIMPNMGLKMGMSHGPIYSYGDAETTKHLNPTLTQEDWDMIVHYYLNLSENGLPENTIPEYSKSKLFEPTVYTVDSLNIVSLTSYDENSGNLFLGNAGDSTLITLNDQGDVLDFEKLDSPPVKRAFKDSLSYILTIGNLSPSDEAQGQLKIGNTTIDKLNRPVDFLIHDLNSDGYDDVFICSYGNNIGDFSLFENQGNGTFKKRMIHPISGSIKVEIANMDADEEDEIVVLFAQEHEMIMIWDYVDGEFVGKKVTQFQPAFGAVDFELRDMNNDGLKDMVIGNGDNSDLSTVLKNFHGVRILLNKGNKEFSETYFFPMHGLSKICAEDFDRDGDVDILAISNFGDFSNPKFKSVQLWVNEGEMIFTPKFVDGLPDFRWQTLDVGDYDKDGDPDVFLGAFNLNIGPEESNISDRKNISWAKLENKTN